nr:GNAT family N-acetyltransferase [Gorillibacterium massiliense]
MPQKKGVRPLGPHETPPYDLLLLADPSRDLVESSLSTGKCFVIELDDCIAGEFVLSHTQNGVAEITNIAVREDFQRQGIGKKLLQSAIQIAKEQGCASLQIATGNSSVNQLMLYQKVGFRIASVEPDYFTRNYQEAIYENGILCRDRLVLTMNLV